MRRAPCSPPAPVASLIDKLRRAQPIRQQAAKTASGGCLVRTADHACGDFPAQILKKDSLRLMTGIDAPRDMAPGELLFLDTETTGLQGGAGTLAFLVGLGRFEDDRFVVRQYLMRDYDEEPYVLDAVLQALSQAGTVITFNGASFDMPLLESRLVMNRLRMPQPAPPHLDLLHVARRVYKMRLGRCNLSRLEAEVFGEPREDDLPGSEVPERYFRYLQTRELALLDDILHHNAQDILSLARLLFALQTLHERPLTAQDQRDLFSLGKVYEKRGERAHAQACYRAVDGDSLREMAQLRLASLLRRKGDPQEAADTYERLRMAGSGGARVYIELSKIYEHRFKAPDRALAIANQGMLYLSERLGASAEDHADFRDLAHRAERLIKRTGGKARGPS